jgi:hypothetical protein
MNVLRNQEFIAGLVMSAVFVAAICGSGVFRSLALTGAAGLICWCFFKFGGANGIVMLLKALQFEFTSRPVFSRGALIGAVATVAVVLALRERSRSS